ANVLVQADVSVGATGVNFAGVVARANAAGDTYYQAGIQRVTAGTRVILYRFVNGAVTVLMTQSVASGSGRVGLQLVGSNLTVSLNGTNLFTVADSSIAGPGTVGIRGAGAATWDNFSAG
ncbi:MAG: hypothetical protein ACRC33_16310, partial [Gemmataceae bacterium]